VAHRVDRTERATGAESTWQGHRETGGNAESGETGKPVLLHKWTSDCCDRNEECGLDIHYEYAMPDGSTKHDWHHTW